MKSLLSPMKRTIGENRYPLSPRILTLKGVLAKIEPQTTVAAAPFPAAKPEGR
jgi:hypothetical protein